MAGGVLRTFGGIFLALGILALLVGLGAAGWGAYDESQNREGSGPFGVAYDPDRAEVNQALVLYGGIAAGIGLLVLVLGIVLLASGSGRANRALVEAVGAGRADGAPAPAAAQDPAAAPAAQGRRGVAALSIGLGIAILLVLSFVSLAGLFGLDALPGSQAGAEASGAPAFSVALHGTLSSGVTVAGNSRLAGDGTAPEPFQVPAGVGRLEVEVVWTPGSPCCATLQLRLERNGGSAWTEVDDHTVSPGASYNVTLGGPGEYRFRVFPGEDGVSAGQDFQVQVTGWA